MIKLGILSSSRGTHVIPIAQAIANKQLPATIEVIISNKSDAPILQKASNLNIEGIFVDNKGLSREDYDQKLTALLLSFNVELIVLIGYMRILSAQFVQQWPGKIINVHPSLLPAHAGLMDLAVHQAVLDAQEQQSGCTVHLVTELVDAGPILVQKQCAVLAGDTAEQLKARIQPLEADALIEAINLINRGKSYE